MDSITLGPWTIHYDADATRDAYAAIVASHDKPCSCAACRNFWLVQARGRAFPPEFLALLHRLGVSFAYPAEVYEQAPNDAASWWYAGWFHFVGMLIIGDSAPVSASIVESQGLRYDGAFLVWPRSAPGCGCWFLPSHALVQDAFVGQPTVQLEFMVDVPWLLDVPASPLTEG